MFILCLDTRDTEVEDLLITTANYPNVRVDLTVGINLETILMEEEIININVKIGVQIEGKKKKKVKIF